MKDDDAKRGPGRPLGAKTEDLPTVVDFGVVCPKCGCTEALVLRTMPPIKCSRTVEDRWYDTLVTQRCKCQQCGRVYVRFSYRNGIAAK